MLRVTVLSVENLPTDGKQASMVGWIQPTHVSCATVVASMTNFYNCVLY